MEKIIFLLCFLMFIPYELALAYIGINIKFKNKLFPSLLFCIIAYFTKIIFNASPIVYIIVITLFCAIMLYVINKVELLLSIIGSLLSITTLVLGSLLVACPFFIQVGFKIPKEPTGKQWVFLTFLEFLIPALVLIILRVKKFVPAKTIS